MIISVLDAASLNPSDLDLSYWEIPGTELHVYDNSTPQQALQRCAESDIVILNKVVITETMLQQSPKLKLIACVATGTNNVDVAAANKRNVRVVNSVNYGTQSVVQHTLALMFSLAGSLPAYNSDVHIGQWAKSEFFCSLQHPIRELNQMTLGIIGYGVLGKELARQAALLGMKVQVAQSLRAGQMETDRLPLDILLQTSDVISLHCPLTVESRGLIGERELALMKPNALLINCARGGIVDEAALAQALGRGHLGGIGFDVLAKEPPAHPHPLTQTGHPNVIITPHMAWGSKIARQNVVLQTAEDIRAFIQGKELAREVTV